MLEDAGVQRDSNRIRSEIRRIGKERELGDLRRVTEERVAEHRQFWKKLFLEQNITNVVAPMVDQRFK